MGESHLGGLGRYTVIVISVGWPHRYDVNVPAVGIDAVQQTCTAKPKGLHGRAGRATKEGQAGLEACATYNAASLGNGRDLYAAAAARSFGREGAGC